MKFRNVIIAGILLAVTCCVSEASPIPNFNLPEKTFFQTTNQTTHGHKVFGWYMMCCGAFGGNGLSYPDLVTEYKAEILMAKSMGMDGFGLDMMEPNEVYHTATAAIFEAAKEVAPDFKLFFEFDEPLPAKDPGDDVALITKYGNHPNYFKVDGLPLVGDYGADCGFTNPADAVKWWTDNITAPLASSGIKIYYVPTTFGQFGAPNYSWISKETANLEVPGWGDVAQGQSVWAIQLSPIGGGIDTLQYYGSALHRAGKSWMTTVSTHYWVGSSRSVPGWYWKPGQPESPDCINGSYFEHAGGQGLDAQWQSVMNVQKPEWVMMLTFNDYNESYMEPLDDYKKYKNGTSDAPLGWYKPQAGMDELNRYYAQWYRTSVKPRITADSIFYAYRTSSASLVASSDTRSPVKAGNGKILDNIYVTTALTSPAELRVSSGNVLTRHKLAAGIHQTVVPFQAGTQSFSLWRNGVNINSVTGEPVVSAVQYYDYWPTTGYVETPLKPAHIAPIVAVKSSKPIVKEPKKQ